MSGWSVRWRNDAARSAVCALSVTALGVLGAAGAHGAAAAPLAPLAPRAAAAAAVVGRAIVVATSPAALTDATAATLAAGGRVLAVERSLGTLVADLPAGASRRLSRSSSVAAVSADRSVQTASLGVDASGQPGTMDRVVDAIGARTLWRQGITGAGVDVALVDTGVAPVTGLLGADKVYVGPDLSFESQTDALRHLDTYGHGTHMAGIIAGREGPQQDGPTYATETNHEFLGVAPDARLVALKLADRNGAVDVSQIIAAIDWVVEHRDSDGLHIRVLNLSFGTPSKQEPQADPLAYAAAVAGRYGIVVVAAAGNNGDDGNGLADPAYSADVIAVGASNMWGSRAPDDDQVSWFSARAGGAAPWRTPDVVAPGASIVSLRAPGSYVSEANPSAWVGQAGLRGSGTSQAAAVVSGGVALLLQQRPWLTPEQVKWLLQGSAHALPGYDVSAQGAGEIDLASAAGSSLGWRLSPMRADHLDWGDGMGSLEQARGGLHVADHGVDLTGEQDILGSPWLPWQTAWATASASMWRAGWWNGALWTGDGQSLDAAGDAWDGRTWTGRTWTGRTWTGRTWTSGVWSGDFEAAFSLGYGSGADASPAPATGSGSSAGGDPSAPRWDGRRWQESPHPWRTRVDRSVTRRWGTAFWR